MNREDANETLQENIDKGDILSGYIEFSIDLNRIIDDFESRTCENCRWFNESIDGDAGYGNAWVSCDEVYMEVSHFNKTRDFCSRFKRKTDE